MFQSTQYLIGEKGEEVERLIEFRKKQQSEFNKSWSSFRKKLKKEGKKIPKLRRVNRNDKIQFARKMKKINKNRKELQNKEIEYNRRKLSTASTKLVV